MLSDQMVKALNEQINKEMFSAYLYLSMSAHSENLGLSGFANWFYVQYQEETFHAMKLYRYLLGQGAEVTLGAIEKPQSKWEGPLAMFDATLKHEQFITKSINDLVDLAITEKDHATHIFLQWYVTEQIEEEANDHEIINKLKLIGGQGNGLFMIDSELSSRVYTPPVEA